MVTHKLIFVFQTSGASASSVSRTPKRRRKAEDLENIMKHFCEYQDAAKKDFMMWVEQREEAAERREERRRREDREHEERLFALLGQMFQPQEPQNNSHTRTYTYI